MPEQPIPALPLDYERRTPLEPVIFKATRMLAIFLLCVGTLYVGNTVWLVGGGLVHFSAAYGPDERPIIVGYTLRTFVFLFLMIAAILCVQRKNRVRPLIIWAWSYIPYLVVNIFLYMWVEAVFSRWSAAHSSQVGATLQISLLERIINSAAPVLGATALPLAVIILCRARLALAALQSSKASFTTPQQPIRVLSLGGERECADQALCNVIRALAIILLCAGAIGVAVNIWRLWLAVTHLHNAFHAVSGLDAAKTLVCAGICFFELIAAIICIRQRSEVLPLIIWAWAYIGCCAAAIVLRLSSQAIRFQSMPAALRSLFSNDISWSLTGLLWDAALPLMVIVLCRAQLAATRR